MTPRRLSKCYAHSCFATGSGERVMITSIIDIDTTFDFTNDSPNYWENFWTNKNGLGAGNSDPDSESKTLQSYQKLLYSRELPNGQKMDLKSGLGSYYLTWNDFRFGSDSITASFRYYDYVEMIKRIRERLTNYEQYMEDYIRKTYTIGGNIIFPKRINSVNQSRGCESKIRDRWDLTLECIRRFYINEISPLSEVLEIDRTFFSLFNDFKGYIDFFFLQDCVVEDYSKVILWTDIMPFVDDPLPNTVDTYLQFIDNEILFVNKRNRRIQDFIENAKG